MRRLRVGEEDAYRRLRKLSSLEDRKLAEVARQVLQAEEVFALLGGPRHGPCLSCPVAWEVETARPDWSKLCVLLTSTEDLLREWKAVAARSRRPGSSPRHCGKSWCGLSSHGGWGPEVPRAGRQSRDGRAGPATPPPAAAAAGPGRPPW
jgi:hypothetical protein